MHTTIAYDSCTGDMSTTWTLLIWTAQAAFDLFTWVLLAYLVVTRSYHGRHDHPPGDRSSVTGHQ